MTHGLILASTAFAFVACSSHDHPVTRTAEPTRVRLDDISAVALLDDDEPLVRAHIPGVGDLTLLVDTGAEFSWIDADVARRVGLPREDLGATLVDIQGIESGVAELGIVDELQIGGVTITHFKPPLFTTLRDEVDGALGQDIFAVLDVVIDGPGGRMIFVPKGTWGEAIQTVMKRGNVAFRYGLDGAVDLPTIKVAVADLEGGREFVIDTGSAAMTFTPALASELGFEPTEIAPAWGLSHAPVDVPFYDVVDLALESLTVSGVAHEAPESRLGWGVLENVVTVFPAGAAEMFLFIEPSWSDAWNPAPR